MNRRRGSTFDVARLLEVLERLTAAGNTVITIEHNLDVIKCADWLIDLGPDGGDRGGSLMIAGPPEAVADCPESYTGKFLRPLLSMDAPKKAQAKLPSPKKKAASPKKKRAKALKKKKRAVTAGKAK